MKKNPHNMFYGAAPIIHEQAKKMRNRETRTEKTLWRFLSKRQLKVKFRRQHPIGQFIADFYCHELKLVIEADGDIHQKKENREYDQMQNQHMKGLGLHVLRFQNIDISENTGQVIALIQQEVARLKIKSEE